MFELNSVSASPAPFKIKKSLRVGVNNNTYLNHTNGIVSSQKKHTFSGWVKRIPATTQWLFSATIGTGTDNTNVTLLQFDSNNKLHFDNYTNSVYQVTILSSQVMVDTAGWYHVVHIWDSDNATAADRCIIYLNGVRLALTGTVPLSNTTWINSGGLMTIAKDARNAQGQYSQGYFAEFVFADGQTLGPSYFGKTDPVTGQWVPKKYTGEYGPNGFYLPFSDITSASTLVADGTGMSNLLVRSEEFGTTWTLSNSTLSSNAVVGPGIVGNWQPTVATAEKLIENGANTSHLVEQSMSFAVGSTYTFSVYAKAAERSQIGLYMRAAAFGSTDVGAVFDLTTGSIASLAANAPISETIISVGSGWYRCSITATATATATAGCWIGVSLGGNSTYLGNTTSGVYIWGAQVNIGTFATEYQLTTSAAITNKNWTPVNFVVSGNTDSYLDTPTNNYCTLNPLNKWSGTLTDANALRITSSGNDISAKIHGTQSISKGKYYFEFSPVTFTANCGLHVGVCKTSGAKLDIVNPGTLSSGWEINSSDTTKYYMNNNSSTTLESGNFGTTNTFQIAIDMDAGKMWFGKNNVWYNSGNPATGANPIFSNITGPVLPYVFIYTLNSGAVDVALNFGQRGSGFTYSPPTGFNALCTGNAPALEIKKPGKYFNTIVWAGDGTGTTRSITGVGFQPDIVWAKNRTNGYSNSFYDSVRGAGANAELYTDTAGSQGQGSNDTYDYLSSFDSNGFTSTWSGSNTRAYFNLAAANYVAWNWKKDVKAGLDIVSYTGNGTGERSITHGLGVVPNMYIVKRTDSSGNNWFVYNTVLGSLKYVELNINNAFSTATEQLPTSTTFNTTSNVNGTSYIAYVFAEKEGFSRIGSYPGNGTASLIGGQFVHCGFAPKYVMFRRTDTASNWIIRDTLRSSAGADLLANSAGAEAAAANDVYFASNGFKLLTTNAGINASGGTYMFIAFAENPFKYSTAK